jgi:AhpD family alkylhydroperoxidase
MNTISSTALKLAPSSLPRPALQALHGVEAQVRESGLEPALLHLVKLLASYRNRCAYCVDMHTKDARARGETEQRLYGTAVWRDTPYFSPRERAAFAWTEALTRLPPEGLPEALFAEARRSFTDVELANLTVAVIAINTWNRLNAAVGHAPGSYQPGT